MIHWTRTLLLCLIALLSLTGCVIYKSLTFVFDYPASNLTLTYHDLCSMSEPNNKNYSVLADWSKLKGEIKTYQQEGVPDLFREASRSLFEENKVLSGTLSYSLIDFGDKPSKTNVLLSFGKEFRFLVIQDEIFLFLPVHSKITRTNGKTFSTAKSTIIVWPLEQEKFEFTEESTALDQEKNKLQSLAPFYQKEQAKP